MKPFYHASVFLKLMNCWFDGILQTNLAGQRNVLLSMYIFHFTVFILQIILQNFGYFYSYKNIATCSNFPRNSYAVSPVKILQLIVPILYKTDLGWSWSSTNHEASFTKLLMQCSCSNWIFLKLLNWYVSWSKKKYVILTTIWRFTNVSSQICLFFLEISFHH